MSKEIPQCTLKLTGNEHEVASHFTENEKFRLNLHGFSYINAV